jgi:hypothetical protein
MLIGSESEIPNAATSAAIQEARHAVLPSFPSVSDLMADLSSQDESLPPSIVPSGSLGSATVS